MSSSNLTNQTQQLISSAQNDAIQRGNLELSSLHVLLQFIEDNNSVLSNFLSEYDSSNPNRRSSELSSLEQLKEKVLSLLSNLATTKDEQQIKPSVDLQKLLALADSTRKEFKDDYLSSEILLLSFEELKLIKESGINKLIDFNFLKSYIMQIRKGESVKSDNAEDKRDALKKYCIDLIEQHKKGKQDPIIGRDGEVRRMIQILSRRTKNNPVLVGEAGVGKTAVVEGLAQRILQKDVPSSLLDKKLYAWDMGVLIAVAKFRGEFEERLKSVIIEVKK